MSATLEERFWAKVDRRGPDECWPWTASRNVATGYGQIHVDGAPRSASRISWQLHNGPIPAGMFVCHRCDNPPCVNPAHLYVGDVRDNTRDAVERGLVPWGEKSGATRLTEADVRSIRGLAEQGLSSRAIARLFPCSQATVNWIVRRVTWRRAA